MSEIDPWALPGDTALAGAAGLPVGAPAYRPVQPLNTKLPWVVIGFGVLYVLVSLVEVYCNYREVTLLNQLNALASGGTAPTQDQFNQLTSDDHAITTVSWIALVVFLGALFAIRAWQGSLNAALGSVGARRAVFNRAGYIYFRGAWVVSILLSVFLQVTTNNDQNASVQDAVNHDHAYMIYFSLRALVGVVLIFFAYRLKKISEEGVARLSAIPADTRGWAL
jgi:hypothetical protein